jgi:hypothetical protein
MKNDNFDKQVNQALNDSVDRLDSDTTQRLFETRQLALAELDRRSWWQAPIIKPVGAVVAGLLVFMIVSPVYRLADNEKELPHPADIELMASVDNLEMVEELEMIQWLLEKEDYAG